MAEESWDFLVARDDLRRTRFADAPVGPLAEGEARFAIDRFAFTANNVTYAVFGDRIGYWRFYPAEEGWGRIPVWGFADLIESRAEGVSAGERFWGYWPMSTQVVLTPGRVSPAGFTDAVPHRAELPAAYNDYAKVTESPIYAPDREDGQALIWPLFVTAFLIDDFLADNGFFGASSVILTSASSKTAIGTAFMLRRRGGVEVIGLTSSGNRAFIEGLGLYDRVLDYDAIETLDRATPTVVVDMAGNGGALATIHRHFEASLKHSAMVGSSHWEGRRGFTAGHGPKPQLFFAPTHGAKRRENWGADAFMQRVTVGYRAFLDTTDDWLVVHHADTREAIERGYRGVLDNRLPPNEGQMMLPRTTP